MYLLNMRHTTKAMSSVRIMDAMQKKGCKRQNACFHVGGCDERSGEEGAGQRRAPTTARGSDWAGLWKVLEQISALYTHVSKVMGEERPAALASWSPMEIMVDSFVLDKRGMRNL